MITEKDLLKLEKMLLIYLSTAYCVDPCTFETDMQGDDQYNSEYGEETIHNTLKDWAESL